MKLCFLLLSAFLTGYCYSQSFELLVLGTAQDAGYPQAGCEKSCCDSVENTETVASVAIAVKNKFWIIDATPDLTEQLATAKHQYPDSKLAGIFLTHAHIGHYTGLMYLGREAMNADSLPVYCMPRMADFLRNNGPWSQLVKLGNIRIIELKEGGSTALSAKVSVTAFEVPHRDEFSETVGYIVASQEKKALYLPDIDKWSRWSQPISNYVKMMDILLLDATFYNNNELPNRDMSEIPHPFVTESIKEFESLNELDKSKIYFIHFNHTNPLLHNSEEVKEVEKAGHHAARTGMKL
ncbi:MBL fold metallo-hydrolase [Salibacteraceae bacterium]|nr:MBL fold metallo-hydrolase [Salibacteraceae bacterium]